MKRISRIKKRFALTSLASIISITLASNVYAQQAAAGPQPGSTEYYLSQIMQYTYEILGDVNNIPSYLGKITEMAISWLATDDSDSTAKLQADFTNIGTVIINGNTAQSVDPVQLAADMLGVSRDELINPPDHPKILNTIPYVNDISYTTLIGQPIIKKAPASPYNYVKNLAATNIFHIIIQCGGR